MASLETKKYMYTLHKKQQNNKSTIRKHC